MSLVFALGGPVGDVLHQRACELADSAVGRSLQRRVWASFATSPKVEYA
jgi:hypothetical protein